MRRLFDEKELEGLTVARAVDINGGSGMVFVFTNDTFAAVGIQSWGDSSEITLAKDLSDYDRKIAGVISQAEYDAIIRAQSEARTAQQEAYERAQYARLKARFES